MSSNKLNNLIDKYNLTNIIKIIVILIILFLVYRIFIESKYNLPSINNIGKYLDKNLYEGFASLDNGNVYGNVISLLDPKNIPVYSGNKCTFKLSDVFRIDSLQFLLNNAYYNSGHTITISFIDGNGNTKNINAISSLGTTINESPNYFIPDSTTKLIKLTSITDENNLAVYTSQINFIVTGNNNTIDNLVDSSGYKYIKGFGIYGGDKNLPTMNEYTNISNTLTVNTSLNLSIPPTPLPTQINKKTFTYIQGTDTKIYSFQLNINRDSVSTPINTTDKPFNISITYQNSIYAQNIFTINNKYIVRSDYNLVPDDNNGYTYIFLSEPIIANNITFTILGSPLTGKLNQNVNLSIRNVTALNKVPSNTDIADYKQTINLLQSSEDQKNPANVCPSINELVNTQTKTQQICDNIEYQDKVKSEKLRLERNKQYLLKLKNQQDQIDELNSAIQELESKREERSQSADQLRVLQYQKQKADASKIRDLANQRLESQANNKLYMDVNVTNI